ncbi:MAG: Rne/Rng family ribonuclease [Pyrinomonadaceae bacterium]
MAKELIVSLNGREKKIAIIENDQVTEFYIERGEENQGIVGNIYKGRVMRVLPGMQSAFVDIGLERDAFLYVSDFFDEEEEFERIVVDKQKSGTNTAEATRAAAERIEQARVEREQRIEATQDSVEPMFDRKSSADESSAEASADATSLDAEEAFTEKSSVADQPADTAAAAPRLNEPQQQTSQQESEADSMRRRGRRNRRRGQNQDNRFPDKESGEPARTSAAASSALADIQTPFVAADNDFQRIIDDEAAAAEEGSMLKDARLQERLTDQIRAVEFDMETTPAAEVGSLFANSAAHSDASFQRIDDGEDEGTEQPAQPVDFVQQTVAAHVKAFVDEIAEETVSNQTQSFERVSDDEKAVEAVPFAAATKETHETTLPFTSGDEEQPAAATTAGTRGKRTRRGSTAKNDAAIPASSPAAEPNANEAVEEMPAVPKRARGAKATAAKTAAKKSAAATDTGKIASAKGSSRRTSKPAAEPKEGLSEDAEASISTRPSRGEFATRRGGRRRRRPNDKPESQDGSTEANQIDGNSNGDVELITEAIHADPIQAEPIVEKPEAPTIATTAAAPASTSPAPRASNTRDQGRRGERPERTQRDERHTGGGRSGQQRGGGGDSRNEGSQQQQRRGGNSRPAQPMITDLLREGQEVLVQIAKEPIAKKGARITSHIALPGRFLVYMPTVEHVGVSRKIESDSERVRLRKLIAAIRNEEDVPSGGFIVRTAGIGISEADLRDDARYLVRTWLDIRKDAEKTKAATVVHQDLDLVQRILRDQLSDDFTAIRVDSEEEYLRIVEFVNRIQPRMVKRVKLHTREEPILEAYGVQAEVDKAIKPRVWLRSGGYLVINQTEALVAIDVNTGKFVGRGGSRLEDTITKTNLEAVEEIVRQIRLRDLGGIIVLDLIDMEDRRNRNRVMQTLQEALQDDKSPTKVLSFNDFGLVIMTRKRVKQSLERTLCAPCPYCTGAGLVKSPQTICYEILEESRRLAKGMGDDGIKQTMLRINPEVARALRSTERDVLTEIEDYLGAVDITSDAHIHQEQFDFAFV